MTAPRKRKDGWLAVVLLHISKSPFDRTSNAGLESIGRSSQQGRHTSSGQILPLAALSRGLDHPVRDS